MKKIIIFCLLFSACSDKYRSVYDAAPRPAFSFSKEVVTIREKEYNNIGETNNGMLTIRCESPGHQLHMQFSCPSDKVHFIYRGIELPRDQPVIAMDSLSLFCGCDTTGLYSVDFYLTDQLGKTVAKQLIINCLANKAAKADFVYALVDSSQTQSWTYRFDGSGSQKTDGLIRAYHFFVDGRSVTTSSSMMDWTFHTYGLHDVGLYVADDLGLNSDTVHKQIIIP